MSDLISREDAIDAVFDTEPFVMMDGKHLNRSTVFQKTSDVIDALSALPSAEAVEVVRCKDCIRTRERDEYTGLLWCPIHRGYMEDTYYCADGWRREDGEA